MFPIAHGSPKSGRKLKYGCDGSGLPEKRGKEFRGLLPDFPPQALAELDGINGPATRTEESTRDVRRLAWCFIDNNDSQDPDQLIVAEFREESHWIVRGRVA